MYVTPFSSKSATKMFAVNYCANERKGVTPGLYRSDQSLDVLDQLFSLYFEGEVLYFLLNILVK